MPISVNVGAYMAIVDKASSSSGMMDAITDLVVLANASAIIL